MILDFVTQGINLKIYPGEITAILGHNGAGILKCVSIPISNIFPYSLTFYVLPSVCPVFPTTYITAYLSCNSNISL